MTTAAHLAALSDAELISAVRGGDVDAYGELFERHVHSARRLALQLSSHGEADDLVSDAFVKVLGVLQRGGGPDVAFRAYLLTAVRRLHVDRIRSTSKVQPTDDLTAFDPGVPFRDIAVEGFENGAAARAFAALPERWQLVLWHLEVEGNKPADIAPLLGMSANSVSALAYRAREGLRQAYLGEHVADRDEASCSWTRSNLGAYVRDGISKRDRAKMETHLEECRACYAIYLELTEINSNLGALIAPLVLGGLAAAYVAGGTVAAGSGAVAAAGGSVSQVFGRARDFVVANVQAVMVAGVAGSVVVVGTAVALNRGPDPAPTGGRPPASQVPQAEPGTTGRGTDDRTAERPERSSGDELQVAIAPDTFVPTTTVTPDPTDDPTTDGPTDDPTSDDPDPTTDPTTDPTPTDPTTDPTPTDPTPTTPSPTTPSPTTPTTPSPTTPSPTTPTPTTPSPTTPTPTTPTTTDLAPALTVAGEGSRKTMVASVENLAAGRTATLRVLMTGTTSEQLDDSRCSQVEGWFRCSVTGESPSVEFSATFPHGGTVSVHVSSPDEPLWQILNNLKVFQINN
ncbi:MAG: sigma-70 family RNA polymerase sigma factor [Nocardioides sp.]|uniref:sigma-70 family RNA polymerase sigma factor n=1 Tax=Nocardioides sp. TaxID=35761 RepID=UPI003F0CB2C2